MRERDKAIKLEFSSFSFFQTCSHYTEAEICGFAPQNCPRRKAHPCLSHRRLFGPPFRVFGGAPCSVTNMRKSVTQTYDVQMAKMANSPCDESSDLCGHMFKGFKVSVCICEKLNTNGNRQECWSLDKRVWCFMVLHSWCPRPSLPYSLSNPSNS